MHVFRFRSTNNILYQMTFAKCLRHLLLHPQSLYVLCSRFLWIKTYHVFVSLWGHIRTSRLVALDVGDGFFLTCWLDNDPGALLEMDCIVLTLLCRYQLGSCDYWPFPVKKWQSRASCNQTMVFTGNFQWHVVENPCSTGRPVYVFT
jgi:hypothetical protein